MGKDFDPKTATPTEVAKQVADNAPSHAAIEELAKKVGEHVGKDFQDAKAAAEAFMEYARQLTENAQKAVEGKPEEASKPDAANPYQAKTAAEWLSDMGLEVSRKAEEAGADEGALKALCKGAAYAMLAKGDAHRGLDRAIADKALGSYEGFVAKALGVDDFSAGGALLQPQMASEVVGALLSETAIWGDPGIMTLEVNGQMEFPYEVTPPTLRHVAENAAMNASEPAFNQVTLRPEACGVIVPVSRKMLRSVSTASAAIERSIRNRFEERLDEKLIRGDGTLNTQTGLRYLVDSSNVLNVNATVSAANTEEDLLRLQQTLSDDNVPWEASRARYMFSPRTWRYLFGLRGTDVHLFKAEMLTGRLLGVPIAGASKRGISNIPDNLSVTDSSESEIYLYETSGLRLGIGSDLVMESSTEAAYNDSSGTVQAAFSRNQMVLKLSAEVGMVDVYRGLGIAVLSDVDWQ